MSNSRIDNNVQSGLKKTTESPDLNLMLEKALVKIRAQKSQIQALEHSRSQPIALVGIGCRFPGDANTPEDFWQLLTTGKSVIGNTPEGRWSFERYLDTSGNTKGTMYTNAGGFIRDVEQFDPAFFGLTPREAKAMDPQHRLLLEVTYESLENAGIAVKDLNGSKTSVVVGMGSDDYRQYLNNSTDTRLIDAYTSLGTTRSIAIGRIAYLLGLQGPAFQLDTSCSSSLLAIHLSCQMLRNGESNLALAGGVNLMLTPEMSVGFSELQALSQAGECRAFDEKADGYVRGEGCGMVVLKRLDDALRDGDDVYAVIKGAAANHDGKSNGLTAPNGAAQEKVIREALSAAKISPQDVGYVEAHGTGTKLGDPIEVLSLGRVYGDRPTEQAPLYLGSVKAGIGHLEAGAGVASFIKTALALKHKTLPAQPSFTQPNSHIPWGRLPLSVVEKTQAWPEQRTPTAGISAFGMSGTNVHLILSAHDANVEKENPASLDSSGGETCSHLAMISAETPKSLSQLAEKYIAFLSENKMQFSPENFAASCNQTRSLLRYRAALVGRNHADFIEQLESLKQDAYDTEPTTAMASKAAFLFTGQGAQSIGMGQSLYQKSPSFRVIFDEIIALIDGELSCSLRDIMWPSIDKNDAARVELSNNLLAQTQYTQPSLFALELALAKLWIQWGVKPQYLMGHSVGEIAAACVAGVFNLPDAVKLVCARARLMQALPEGGSMTAVHASEQCVLPHLEAASGTVVIAGVNSPEQCVISGNSQSLKEIGNTLIAHGLDLTPLNVSHAFHSPLMAPMLEEFSSIAASIDYHTPSITMVSTVDATLDSNAFAQPQYWVEQVCAAVRFSEGVSTLDTLGCRQYIELGPKPTLIGMALSTLDTIQCAIPSLRKNQDDWECLQQGIGQWVSHGLKFDFNTFYNSQHFSLKGKAVRLPSYSFDHAYYFAEGETVERYRGEPQSNISIQKDGSHPLIGEQLILPLSKTIHFQQYLRQNSPVYMQDHVLFGHVIGAAASHLVSFISAAEKTLIPETSGCTYLHNILVMKPLLLSGEALPVQVIFRPEGKGHNADLVSMPSHTAGNFETHVSARLTTDTGSLEEHFESKNAYTLMSKTTAIGNDEFYASHAQLGFQFGPCFQLINKLWRVDSHHSLVEVKAQNDILSVDPKATLYPIYPSQLDVCIQTLGDLMNAQIDNTRYTYIPFSLAEVNFEHYLLQANEPLMCDVKLHHDQDNGGDSLVGDIWIWQKEGGLIATVKDFEWRKVSNTTMRNSLQLNENDHHCYQQEWQDKSIVEALPASNKKINSVIVFAEENALSDAVIAYHTALNTPLTIVYRAVEYSHIGDKITVDPRQKEHLERLNALHDAANATTVFLWSSSTELEAACIGLTHWLQSIDTLSRLLIVSQDSTQGFESDYPYGDIGQAFWGYTRSLVLERPDIHCTTLHASANDSAESIATLAGRILNSTNAETHLRLDNAQVQVARLKPTALPETAVQIKAGCTYLLTGAFGGVGRLLMTWLVAQGAKHLTILSHRQASSVEREWLDALNVDINIHIIDITHCSHATFTNTLKSVEKPLAGVFHLAGRVQDSALEGLNLEKFQQVIGAKALGGWNLLKSIAAVSSEMTVELDFIVMFSSASGVLGSAGQINYAAANAYLDGLVDFGRRQGLPVQSVAWGLWAGIGMGADKTLVQRLAHTGIKAIEREQAFVQLSQILSQAKNNAQDNDHSQRLVIVPTDWPLYLKSYYGVHKVTPSFLSELVTRATKPSVSSDNAQSTKNADENIARLQALPLAAREKDVAAVVKKQLKMVMSFDISHVDMDRPLQELGMDSLMAVAIRDGIGKYFGRQLPTAILFKQPSAAALTRYLLDEFFQQEESPGLEKNNTDSQTISDDDNIDIDALLEMSDSEVDLLLDLIGDD